MSKNYLAVVEDIDGKEHLVALYGSKEVEECVKLLEKEDSSYKLVGIQGVNMFLSLLDLKQILNSEGKYPSI